MSAQCAAYADATADATERRRRAGRQDRRRGSAADDTLDGAPGTSEFVTLFVSLGLEAVLLVCIFPLVLPCLRLLLSHRG